jgi:hypothetical protein
VACDNWARVPANIPMAFLASAEAQASRYESPAGGHPHLEAIEEAVAAGRSDS